MIRIHKDALGEANGETEKYEGRSLPGDVAYVGETVCGSGASGEIVCPENFDS